MPTILCPRVDVAYKLLFYVHIYLRTVRACMHVRCTHTLIVNRDAHCWTERPARVHGLLIVTELSNKWQQHAVTSVVTVTQLSGAPWLSAVETVRGSATPMKMGGGGTGTRRAANPGFSSEATHTKNRKLSGFGPLFSWKWGGLSPALSKMGGRIPPSLPLWRSPWRPLWFADRIVTQRDAVRSQPSAFVSPANKCQLSTHQITLLLSQGVFSEIFTGEESGQPFERYGKGVCTCARADAPHLWLVQK